MFWIGRKYDKSGTAYAVDAHTHEMHRRDTPQSHIGKKEPSGHSESRLYNGSDAAGIQFSAPAGDRRRLFCRVCAPSDKGAGSRIHTRLCSPAVHIYTDICGGDNRLSDGAFDGDHI